MPTLAKNELMARRLHLAGKSTDFWDYRESFHQVYYTGADLANRTYRWWFDSDAPMIAAIRSCEYEFIAFEYLADVETIEAIQETGYEQIVPAAWQRRCSPSVH